MLENLDADEEPATLAKAIGNPVRVRILRMLAQKDVYVCGIIGKNIPLAQSPISQHVKVLKEAGLIRGTVEGARICYTIEARTVRRLKVLRGRWRGRRSPCPRKLMSPGPRRSLRVTGSSARLSILEK